MGGGFHIDRGAPGIKAMVYLNDVRGEQGPFTTLVNYNAGLSSLQLCSGDPHNTQDVLRFDTGSTIALLTAGFPQTYLAEIHAPKGTVIFFLTANIHRGKNNFMSERLSITNAYGMVPPHLQAHAPSETTGIGRLRRCEQISQAGASHVVSPWINMLRALQSSAIDSCSFTRTAPA